MSLPPLFDNNFPTFYKETYGCVNILWYEPDFTQNRYPPGQETSKACTLICLLVAQRIGQQNLNIYDVDSCLQFNIVIAEAIIEGNEVYSRIIEKKLVQHPYLNAVEALQFGGPKLCSIKEWKFQVFYENLDTSLFRNIKTFLCEWYQNPKASMLFMLLITCDITILLIFQEKSKKVILFDSHGHNVKNANRGLVVAQASIASLEELCNWYIKDVIHNCYQINSKQYELTCLYYLPKPPQTRQKSNNCLGCQCGVSRKR